MVGRVTAGSGSGGTDVYQVRRYSTVPPWASKLRAVDVLDAALVLLAGLAAGTINAIIGSGTLITFPVLLAAGFAPVVANQTSTLGLVPGSLAAVLGSRRDLAGHGRRTARYAACSLVGSATGAALLLSLPAQAFETVVPLLIAGALVLIVLQPRVARAVAERRRPGAAELGPVALVALAGDQRLAGEMDRHERRGARGVDGDRRPFQIQVIGDTGGADRKTVAGRFDVLRIAFSQQEGILAAHDAHVDAALAVAQRCAGIAGVLEGAITFLHEQAMLRIHDLRFGRRYLEKHRVEVFGAVEQPEPFAIDLARLARGRVVVRIDIPALRRDFLDRVSAFDKVVPELVEIVRAGVATRHADDGDPVVVSQASLGATHFNGRFDGRRRGARTALQNRPFASGRWYEWQPCGDRRSNRRWGLRRGGRRSNIGRQRKLFGRKFRKFFFNEPGECVKVGIVVNPGRGDLQTIGLVDHLHPFHADDRIQSQIDEWLVVVDRGFVEIQRLRKAFAQRQLQRVEVGAFALRNRRLRRSDDAMRNNSRCVKGL